MANTAGWMILAQPPIRARSSTVPTVHLVRTGALMSICGRRRGESAEPGTAGMIQCRRCVRLAGMAAQTG